MRKQLDVLMIFNVMYGYVREAAVDAAKLARNKVGIEGAVQFVACHVFQARLAAVKTLALLPAKFLVPLESFEQLTAKLTLAPPRR